MARIKEPTTEQYAQFGRYVAVSLGANTNWGNVLEDFAEVATAFGVGRIGSMDDETVAFWRKLADKLDIYYNDDGEV